MNLWFWSIPKDEKSAVKRVDKLREAISALEDRVRALDGGRALLQAKYTNLQLCIQNLRVVLAGLQLDSATQSVQEGNAKAIEELSKRLGMPYIPGGGSPNVNAVRARRSEKLRKFIPKLEGDIHALQRTNDGVFQAALDATIETIATQLDEVAHIISVDGA